MLVYTKIFSYNIFLMKSSPRSVYTKRGSFIIVAYFCDLISSKFNYIKEIILERTSRRSFRVLHFVITNLLLLRTQFLIEKSIELKLNEITQFSQFQKCQSSKNGYDRSMSK